MSLQSPPRRSEIIRIKQTVFRSQLDHGEQKNLRADNRLICIHIIVDWWYISRPMLTTNINQKRFMETVTQLDRHTVSFPQVTLIRVCIFSKESCFLCESNPAEGIDLTKVIIDAMDGDPISFEKDHPVYFERWSLDRGSYLIWVEKYHTFSKLATEFDPIKVIE